MRFRLSKSGTGAGLLALLMVCAALRAQDGDSSGPAKGGPAKSDPGSAGDAAQVRVGCIAGDCSDGEGKLRFASGVEYEGGFRHGLMHGAGRFSFPDRTSYYRGEFDAGRMHGTGERRWPDGTVYRGGWRHGNLHGAGTLRFADGGSYTGAFDDGKLNGRGRARNRRGDRIEGV